jgi:predicted nuclease with TOPRIM domain
MKIISTTKYNEAIECINNANNTLKVLIAKNEKLEADLEQWKAKSNAIERDYALLEKDLKKWESGEWDTEQ